MEQGLSQPGSLTFVLKTRCPQRFSLHVCFRGVGILVLSWCICSFCLLIALVFASLCSCKTVSKQDLGGSPAQSRLDQDRGDVCQGSGLLHFPSPVLGGPQAAVSSCVGATCLKTMPVSGLSFCSLKGLEGSSPRRRLRMRGDDCESRGWDRVSSPLRGPVLGALLPFLPALDPQGLPQWVAGFQLVWPVGSTSRKCGREERDLGGYSWDLSLRGL